MDTGALEVREARDVEPAIPGAGGDHHGSGASLLAAAEVELEGLAGRVGRQADRLVGNGHLHPELLGLVVGARHQGHAADAGGKAQIVLDARRGARLTAESPAIEHQGRQPLRSGVDRRGEARRPGANNGHVIEPLRIDGPHHADAAGELALGGVTQHLSAGTEHDGKLSRLDGEALDQRLGVGIGLRVQGLVRVAVARQEAHQAQDIGVGRRTQDHGTARPPFDQADPTQDQGPHDLLTQFRLGHQQGAQPLGGHDHRLDGGLGGGVHQAGTPGELSQLPHEGPGAVGDDQLGAVAVSAADDLHMAREDQGHAMARLPGAHHDLPGLIGPLVAKSAGARQFGGRQGRKPLVVAGVVEGGLKSGHDLIVHRLRRQGKVSDGAIGRDRQPCRFRGDRGSHDP